MQQEIDPVIALWLLAVAENRVIEQIGKRRERPIQRVEVTRWRPVRAVEDSRDIVRREGMDAGVHHNDGAIVENESAAEGIAPRQQNSNGQRRAHRAVFYKWTEFRRRIFGDIFRRT